VSRRSEQREKRAKQQWVEDLAWFMSSPRGRRIAAWLLEQGHHGKCVFSGNSHGNFMQGKQALAIEFANECRIAALQDFHRMEVEALIAQRQAKAEADADQSDDPDAGQS
jgi:hypothetical protein